MVQVRDQRPVSIRILEDDVAIRIPDDPMDPSWPPPPKIL